MLIRRLLLPVVGFSALLLSACAGGGSAPQSAALSSPRAPAHSAPPVQLAEISAQPVTVVRAALGEPALKRQESPAEVWQYRGADCVLDVFFYPGPSSSPSSSSPSPNLQAAYIESRGLDGQRRPPQSCLDTLPPAPRPPAPRTAVRHTS